MAQIKAFLTELQQNNDLLRTINNAATANEIDETAHKHGFQFSGEELKTISKSHIPGVKIKKQDTSPSYSFVENGN